MLLLGWQTAAIVPELAKEIRIRNTAKYQNAVAWSDILTQLIETYQKYAEEDVDVKEVIQDWFVELQELR